MSATYLHAPYKDRERVKALGARWDPVRRQWYVPAGRDLAAFSAWLPAVAGAPPREPAAASMALVGAEPAAPWDATAAPAPSAGRDVSAPERSSGALEAHRGQSLSALMAAVAASVAQSFRQAAWTRVEVVKADVRRGHVYLELAERDPQGQVLAQARGMVWADTAQRLLPRFEQATGMVMGAGLKLLVRARPQVHGLYGLSLVIEDLDPDYSLGDLEARKREIRQQLQREGLWDAQRRLAPPWDFTKVLVVAPEGAAGLGDFRAEADRLAAAGVCHFDYVHSRFQGEGAAAEIVAVLEDALRRRTQDGAPLWDAIALIRGGGAVNDLAWLNDLALARCLCQLPVPVFTGIGHERDRCVLDEVAHLAFDTPSKVVLGMVQQIRLRVQEVRAAMQAVALLARRRLDGARQGSRQQWQGLQWQAGLQLVQARQQVPALMQSVRAGAQAQVMQARATSRQRRDEVGWQAVAQCRQARERVPQALAQVREAAREQLIQARQHTQALLREVTGQGPERTLARGFAVVRDAASGQVLTRAAELTPDRTVLLQYQDGGVPATITGPMAAPSLAGASTAAPSTTSKPRRVRRPATGPQDTP
ncbi:exodeoxyribonuclease VII large subunit [Ideonella livida]|uniref:Exodeoxyribonuclease VII large subunit n=1 Tax=Ideonella livida TaxID=2707176 RepID=A0A7C9PJ72_9BURK|nr:exodeoxyribonuclease VII large subunit [Ideonella livida]NDY93029.1 exodeoxyribonuclease VII large subunit [Ideonella livida]